VKEIFAIVAALLAVAGNLPYLWAMVKGRVRPHLYTWLIGSIVSGTVFFGMFAKGAGIGSLPVAVSELFTVLIFILSFKYGYRKITILDRACLAVALIGLVPWAFTHDPTASVIIAVAVDLMSLVPTFRKTWNEPSTEQPGLYASNALRHVLAVLSLATYNVATTLHSLTMILSNTGLLAVIYRKKYQSGNT